MNQVHRALIVEDEPEAAADLAEILRTCGCESVVVTNRRDALEQLDEAAFCIILLDLEIKAEADSIRGRLDHGKQLLRDARGRYPQLVGAKYALPIVVLSGFASETEAAVAVMKDGASDVVQKLCTAKLKADRIQEALETSGRPSHRVCDERQTAATQQNPRDRLTLSIPGDQDGRRVVVRVGTGTAPLTYGSLKVLLHLVKARLSGSLVHKTDLGARSDRGFRGISVLRQELAAACGNAKELITNDQRGSYGLADRVLLGPMAMEKLQRLGDHTITKLAREIRSLSAPMEESAGKG